MARYTKEQLIQRIREEASACGLDPNIAVEQLRRESVHFADKYVYGPGTSYQGAMGLAQFLPGTWTMYGGGGDPFNPDDALRAYCAFMNDLLNQFGGDYARALIGYHAGPKDVEGVLRNPTGNPKSTAYYKEILAAAGASPGFRRPPQPTVAGAAKRKQKPGKQKA